MPEGGNEAPGRPGIQPHWLSGAKSGIGKSLNAGSAVSFTISHGIINEVYFPREDIACINQLGFVVTDGKDFFSSEKENALHETKMFEEGVPAYFVTNRSREKRYAIEKEIITDPKRNSLMQRIRFVADNGGTTGYHLYMLLSPHVRNYGHNNNGWVGSYKGVPMLFAGRDDIVLAAACSVPWKKKSVGFRGVSDALTELKKNKVILNEYEQAYCGNIMLAAEIDLENAIDQEVIITVGFGFSETEAGHFALASLMDGFETAEKMYVAGWQKWQKSLSNLRSSGNGIGKIFRASAAVLKTSEAKLFPGAILASLSIPWGQSRTEDDLGGYHLVWPRDLAETSWGLLALNAREDVLQIVNYLMATQQTDGSWSQNMWIDGKPYWTGIQMDQVALPILLLNTCLHYELLDTERLRRYWEGIRLAAVFILKNGPFTDQDRWEMQRGIAPFTIATEIPALLAAAEFAELFGDTEMAQFCRETADYWNENIETWTYVNDTPLSKKYGVEGYYVRINPTEGPINENKEVRISLGNQKDYPAIDILSVDALALVRFGLRKADDPRILNTIKLIDGELKVETPTGACWHRFTNDAYGEDDEGNPSSENGRGRAWPLLTGERAHYEIAAGDLQKAKELLKALESFSYHDMLPEQIWDTGDLPSKELFFGKYTGSAMPLTWAHAEYIKLCKSVRQKKVFDMPEHSFKRYIEGQAKCSYSAWRFSMPIKRISTGKKILRIEVLSPATVLWTHDDWQTKSQIDTKDTTAGIHYADISLNGLQPREIVFTFFWKESKNWENKNFTVSITG